MVNERAKGELTIEYLGGPEIISDKDLAIGVGKGVLEMGTAYSGIYAGLVPGAEAFTQSMISPLEERQRGVYDFIQPQYAKNNLFLLGRVLSDFPGEFYYIATTKKVETLSDLAGLKITSFTPGWIHFLDAIGAPGPIVGPPDIYTTVERGVADGSWLPFFDHVAFSLIDVEKYLIDHGFGSDNFTIFLNLDTWNKLPKHLQDLLIKTVDDIGPQLEPGYQEQRSNDRQVMQDAGVSFVWFSGEDAEKYVNTAYDAEWEDIIKKYPEIGTKLRELLSK